MHEKYQNNESAIASLERDIREMKFGTIGGLLVRDGCIRADSRPQKRYTRKPRSTAASGGEKTGETGRFEIRANIGYRSCSEPALYGEENGGKNHFG